MTKIIADALVVELLLLSLALLSCRTNRQSQLAAPARPANTTTQTTSPTPTVSTTKSVETHVVMHNVLLNEGPGLKLRVRWLRGRMHPTQPGVTPSFDQPSSFSLDIDAGVVGISLADLSSALNSGLLQGSQIKNVSLVSSGKEMKLRGTLHKGISFPIEMTSDLGVAPDGRIHVHIEKLSVLKLPVKGLLEQFRVQASDIVEPKNGSKGVEVVGDDIFFDPEQILPDPRQHGRLTDVHLRNGDMVEVFGSARQEAMQAREWRNFISLRGGTVEFGKLTMHDADIAMIDVSQDEWFRFDLTRYQEQIVNGHTKMTPQAGLRIFMPDIDKVPATKSNKNISLQWVKNRNIPPPADVTP
jgi:hypothetical protein